MKTILTTFFLCTFSLFAENIGTFDSVSHTWYVKSGNFSCRFNQGQMFPSRFMLRNAVELPRIGFNDNIMDIKTKNDYYLKLDRWAEAKIITNTPQRFSIELTGKFCRIGIKHKEELPGVTATYRYDFSADKPGFKMSFRLQKTPQASKDLRVVRSLSPFWYEIWFTSWRELPNGAKQELISERFIDRHRTKGVEFIGEKYCIQVFSPRIIAILTPKWGTKSFVNAGLWGTDWKTTEASGSAEFLFMIKQ